MRGELNPYILNLSAETLTRGVSTVPMAATYMYIERERERESEREMYGFTDGAIYPWMQS